MWIYWRVTIGLLLLIHGTHGYIYRKLTTRIGDVCCKHGVVIAKEGTMEDCFTATTAEEQNRLGQLCVIFIKECCKEHLDKAALTSSTTPTRPLVLNRTEEKRDNLPKVDKLPIDTTRPITTILNNEAPSHANNGQVNDTRAFPDNSTTKHNRSSQEGMSANRCPFGYRVANDTCEDIDECSNTESNPCGPLQSCSNFPGGYNCTCPHGYEAGLDMDCKDIDECSATASNPCGPLQSCSNVPGGYNCTCPHGYEAGPDMDCKDIDECSATESNPCGQLQSCSNVPGGYNCTCPHGYEAGPDMDCKDVDECSPVKQVCLDIDECGVGAHVCGHRCLNTRGSYRCSCYEGFTLNPDERTCDDVDECAANTENACVGGCVNEPGSYRCTCPFGYYLSNDERSCVDINECDNGPPRCGDAPCVNTHGSYYCHNITCHTLFTYDAAHRSCNRSCDVNSRYCSNLPIYHQHKFVSIVSKVNIPEGGLGIYEHNQDRSFSVEVPYATAPKQYLKYFDFRESDEKAMISLIRPIAGPDHIEIYIRKKIFYGEKSQKDFHNASITLHLYVSEYKF